ncbi:MAG: ferredoxin-type protein NapF [Rhodocyclaceae bacterium]|nr:ferredoxin-type protein NapF [Rhodocyclaceae bacterium]
MQFLRGRFHEAPPAVRPPWALAEEGFTAVCSRCDGCLRACPTGILKRGAAGFPEVDFSRGECTFCGECVAACPTLALDRAALNQGLAPWSLAAEIQKGCLALNKVVCRSCGEVCELGAIAFRLAPGGVSLPEVDGAACNGCGACVAICPAAAVTVGRKTENLAAEAA